MAETLAYRYDNKRPRVRHVYTTRFNGLRWRPYYLGVVEPHGDGWRWESYDGQSGFCDLRGDAGAALSEATKDAPRCGDGAPRFSHVEEADHARRPSNA